MLGYQVNPEQINNRLSSLDTSVSNLNTNKANTGLENLAIVGKDRMSKAALPSNRYITITAPATNEYITAPANGWYAAWTTTGTVYGGFVALTTGDVDNSYGAEGCPPATYQVPVLLPVIKGQQVKVGYSTVGISMFRFYYAEGN